jgi:hypothetical protein
MRDESLTLAAARPSDQYLKREEFHRLCTSFGELLNTAMDSHSTAVIVAVSRISAQAHSVMSSGLVNSDPGLACHQLKKYGNALQKLLDEECSETRPKRNWFMRKLAWIFSG